MALHPGGISFELVHMHARTRLVYFYFSRVNFFSKHGPEAGVINCGYPQVTYLHTNQRHYVPTREWKSK